MNTDYILDLRHGSIVLEHTKNANDLSLLTNIISKAFPMQVGENPIGTDKYYYAYVDGSWISSNTLEGNDADKEIIHISKFN